MTEVTSAGERESTGEIFEKEREREGMVKLGFKKLGFSSGKLGFLRKWSLIKEWKLSAIWESRGERLEGFLGCGGGVSSSSRSDLWGCSVSMADVEKGLRGVLERVSTNLDLINAIWLINY